jgi:hypothetical protein
MGANYTRQSTYADGDTISAADTNDEFNQLLAAFAASTGHTHDGTTGEGGPITALATNAVTFGTGADTDVSVTFDANTNDGVITWMEDEDYFQFSDDVLMSTTEKIQFRDTAIYLNSSTDGQLDIVADTEVQIAATTIDVNGNLDVSGTVVGASTISAGTAFVPDASDGAALGTSSLEFSDLFLADAAVINLGADQDTTLTHVADTGILLNSTRQLQFGDSGTYIHQSADGVLDLVSDTEIEINATTIDINGDVEISGDLTVSGDDITMGTNTAGNLLIADGTNFNSVAAGSLSEISTVANDDVLIAVDTSGGGLKKITRSTLVAGLATSSGLSNVVEDTTPQLGGSLDVNGEDIVSVSNGNITLTPNGTGVVRIDGSNGIDMQSGAISIKNSGAQSYVRFYCETSNAHYAQLQAPAHSDFSGNITLTLPATTDTVAGIGATQTLTNKTLTSPAINTAIVPASADGATLGTASAEFSDLFLADGGTIQFGNDQEITLTHVADSGLTLKHASTSDDKFPTLTLAAGDNDIAADDKLGVINFIAPDEGAGTDAITVAAGIEAVSEGDFSASVNTTKLSFKTATSGVATEKMSLSSAGLLTIADDFVIKDAGTIGSASDTDAIAIASNGVVNFTQQPTVSSAAVKVAGKETIWIPAAAMYPESTNGCASLAQVELSNGPELKALDFDKSSDEHAQFTIAFPKSWNEGTVTFQAYFTATSTDTGTTAWGLSGVSLSDNGDLNTAFGTTVVATAKAHSGTSNDLDVTAESGDVTIAGSPAAGDLCIFQVLRDVSADDLDADARLLGIKLFFTTDAANDA